MTSIRWLWLLLIALAVPIVPAPAGSVSSPTATAVCAPVDDVDSCWKEGVVAERRGDQAAALAAYDRSCTAGLTIYGCYEAGKIAFSDPRLRDYQVARARMARVCASPDIGMGPYGCTFLGIMQRDGLGGPRQLRESTFSFVRACFTHNDDHYIDGRGCAALADDLPTADVMDTNHIAWPRPYIRYLAYAMGCTDQMPQLCGKATDLYRRGEAASADWMVMCEEHLAGGAPAGICPRLADPALSADLDHRHVLRRTLARMFGVATDLPARP